MGSYLPPRVPSPLLPLNPKATIPLQAAPPSVPAQRQGAWPRAQAAYKGGSAFILTLKVSVLWSLP